jgi:hypothetical protein
MSKPDPWSLVTIITCFLFVMASIGVMSFVESLDRPPEPKPCAGIERPTSSGGIRCDLGKT